MQNLSSFFLKGVFSWLLIATVVILSSCGGGNSGGVSSNKSHATHTPSSSSSSASNSSASSVDITVIVPRVMLTGTITYDYIPHKSNHIGLNYLAIESRPVRGAVVEILDESGAILDVTTTTANGSYLFSVPVRTLLKVRVKAELLNTSSPTWDFKVTDNTTNNALYSLVGSLVSVGEQDSQRNLHANSGWDGSSYSSLRAAAPFAILDDIYVGVSRLNEAGNRRDFKPIEMRWSTKNNDADGAYTLGEIGTTFFDGDAIYILGDANNDTDEFDGHVILHEWGHYVEENFSRSDSIGGSHSDGEKLDVRLAMSEGFANAFSAMMLNSPYYMDSSGSAQNSGFSFNVSNKIRTAKGFFSEGSIGSIFYNYYSSSNNKIANDFTPIFSVLNDISYFDHEAMTSIFLFYGRLKALLSDQAVEFNSMMREQNINGTDEYGAEEINNGGLVKSLPVYSIINPDNLPVNVCSSPEFGKFNKLSNSRFLKLTISQSRSYRIFVTKNGGADAVAKPEMVLYSKGKPNLSINNTLDNMAIDSKNLTTGTYVLEVYDLSNHLPGNTNVNTFCFDVRVMAN